MLSAALDRSAPAAGLLALPLYAGLLLILGALEPGYSHLELTMSILGGVPGARGLAFNLGVAATGLLVIVFALGLRRMLPRGWTTNTGALLLMLGGAGLIGAAVFHCDPSCVNVLESPTAVGRLHIVTALAGGMCSSFAPFFFWAAMRRDERWRAFAAPTFMAGLLANLPGIIFWVTFATGNRLEAVEGLIQRLGLIFVLIWIFAAAIKLSALKSSTARSGVGEKGSSP